MLTKRQVEFLVPAFLICLLAGPFVLGSMVSDSTANSDRTNGTNWIYEENDSPTPHIPLPDEVRGLYWTAVTATSSRGDELLTYMLESGLNTAVIDVKMDNGELAFDVGNDQKVPYVTFVSSGDDLRQLLGKLYDAGIYRIARIAVMRDSAFAQAHPNLALGSGRATGFWRDSTGSAWLDPAAPEVAQYAIELGRRIYGAGFDEIQYDYVRFASDGAINSIVYPIYDSSESKVAVMQRFFEQVGGALRADGIPVSFDVFGMTFWSHDDYNIGQRLVDVLPYADFISPMVYPSHYVDGFKGYGNPAQSPYEIVKRSLDEGLRLTHGIFAGGDDELVARFRPWLQDFDIGAVYTSTYIEAQIQAARDAGASGWMLWNARNVYEPAQYRPQ